MDANKLQAYIDARSSGQSQAQATQTAAATKEYTYNPLSSKVAMSGAERNSAKDNPLTRKYNQTVNELNIKSEPVETTTTDTTEKKSWLGETAKATGKGSGSAFLNALTTIAHLIGQSQQQQITPNAVIVQATTDALTGNKDDTSAIEKVAARNQSVNSNENLEKTFNPLYEKADTLQAESAEHTQNAKDAAGNTTLGNVATDLAVNAGQMAIEAPLNLVAPGASLFGLGIRSFGSSAQEARQAGANQFEQLAYGTAKAATEVATEKLFDGLAGLHGGGAADDLVNSWITSVANGSKLKTTLLTLGTSVAGEATEEGIAGVLDPIEKAIYDNGAAASSSYLTSEGRKNLATTTAYDMLIGGLLGGFGGIGKVITASPAAVQTVEESVTDPTALEQILGSNSKYSKAASEILSNPEALAEYEANYGKVEGNSNTEKAKNLAAALYLTMNQKAESTETTQAVPETMPGAEHPMAMPNALENAQNPMAMPQNEGADPNTAGQIGAVMQIRSIVKKGITFSDAAEIADDPTMRAVFEDMYDVELSKNKGKAKEQIVEIAKSQQEVTSTEAEPSVNGTTLTAEESYVRGLLMNGAVDEIINNPKYVEAFNQLTGQQLSTDHDTAVAQITEVINSIKNGDTTLIENGSQANYSPTDQASYRPKHQGETYKQKYGKHTGQGRYAKVHNKPTADNAETGTHEWSPQHVGTEEEVTDNTPFENPEYTLRNNALTNATRNTQNSNAQENSTATQQITQDATENATESVKPTENGVQTEQNGATVQNTQQNAPNNPLLNTQRQQTAADFGDDQGVTQDTIIESNLNDAEYNEVGGVTTHAVHHDVDVDSFARSRIENDPTGAREDLLAKENYDDIDVATSNMVIAEDVAKAREAVNSGNAEEATKMWQAIAEIRNAREKALTKIGQALRQAGRQTSTFTNVTDDIISDATTQLFGEDSKTRKGVTNEDKVNLMNEITTYAERLVEAQNGTAEDTIKLIHDVSATRKTTSLLSDSDLGIIDSALRKIASFDGGKEFLDNLATTQIRSIAGDYNKTGIIDSIKAIRYLNALSNPKTANTNVLANTVFGTGVSTTSNNIGVAFDMLMSAFTGKRTMAFDRSVFSSDTWTGANEAMLKSFVQVALDAEADQASYAYNEIKGTHFKMTGNWFERFLATCEKYQGFALKTTDQLAKGGAEAETKRGLSNIRNGEITEEEINDIAKEEAKYRTLQTDSKVSKALSEVKSWLNRTFHIGNAKTGTIGIGDHFIMFAQVPANQVVTQLQLQPALSGIDALGNVAKMFVEAKNGEGVSTTTQRKAAMSFGRAVNGAALVGAGYALAAMGCIRCVDEDDDDLAMMLKAQGKTGTQWNISATARLVSGGDSTAQEGDTWMSLSWIPQLNSMAITGSSIYNSKLDDGSIDVSDVLFAMGKGLKDSLSDFPAVSGITSTIKSWSYAKYEGEDRADLSEEERSVADIKAKTGAVLGNELGNVITSTTVPAIVRAIASGTDDTERNTFRSNNPLERAKDVFKAGVPGLRETVSPKIDNFGNEVKNEGGLTQFTNKVFLPGALTHDRTTEAQAFTEEMVNKLDDTSIVPDRNSPTTVSITVNGVTSTARLTEEERKTWQTTYGTTAESLYLDAKNNETFQALPDEVQQSVLKDLLSVAKGLASSEFKQSRGAEYDNDVYNLLNKYERKGDEFTALSTKNIVDYYCNKEAFKTGINNDDYAAIDKVTSAYKNMDANLQKVMEERVEDFGSYLKVAKEGVGAESWSKVKDELDAIQWEEDTDSDNSRLKYKAIIDADIPESDKDKLIGMEDYVSKNWKMADTVLSKEGFSKQEIYDFFSNADWTYSENSGEYNANGQLGAYEAFVALQKTIPDDDAKRRRIFNAFVEATGDAGRYDGWSRDTGYNKWTKYSYDYCKKQVAKYGGTNYGTWNDSKSSNYNALTETKPTGINSDLNQWILKNF